MIWSGIMMLHELVMLARTKGLVIAIVTISFDWTLVGVCIGVRLSVGQNPADIAVVS